eukprot:3110292-Rhodomonas_salina.1
MHTLVCTHSHSYAHGDAHAYAQPYPAMHTPMHTPTMHTGLHGLGCCSKAVIASRSYVNPSAASTGSCITCRNARYRVSATRYP